MPKLIDSLSEIKKKALLKMLAGLKRFESEVIAFNEQITHYKMLLNESPTTDVFFDVVAQINKTSQEANAVFSPEIIGMDNEMRRAFKQLTKTNSNLAMVFNAIYFSDALSDTIIATKERLSEQALYRMFGEDKLEMARNFIDSVRSLQSVVEEINKQREEFSSRLTNSSTYDDVDFIEMEIEMRDKAIRAAYEELVHFPTDQKVAGALIEFLEKNTHLLALMKAFDFHESLVDEILGARARVDTNSSHRI